jgi:4-hydroxybenzoate polyprenyltransferase
MLRAYAQLLRLPNVFTAWADVLMGWMVGMGSLEPFLLWEPPFLPFWVVLPLYSALGASGCLYCAGMVWNDFFDVEEDRRDRPHRPIPSRRVSRLEAGILGGALMLAGLALTAISFVMDGNWHLLGTAGVLCLLILLYDAWLKHTLLGALAMGACRFCNVLLGLIAAAPELVDPWILGLPGVIALYIVGVTWFARKEAGRSGSTELAAAAWVMIIAIMIGFVLMWRWIPDFDFWRQPGQFLFPILLIAWGVIICRPLLTATRDPRPQRVQTAVKTCILGLIGLDALLAFAVVGWPGLLILLLLPPALILGRWVYST